VRLLLQHPTISFEGQRRGSVCFPAVRLSCPGIAKFLDRDLDFAPVAELNANFIRGQAYLERNELAECHRIFGSI